MLTEKSVMVFCALDNPLGRSYNPFASFMFHNFRNRKEVNEIVKRWLVLGIALVFGVGIAAASFADQIQLDNRVAAVKKAKKAVKKAAPKKAAPKKMSAPMMEPAPLAPSPVVPAPIAKPAPSAPRYVASAAQYEITVRGGVMGGGFGGIGTIAMPTVLNDVVKALGLDQIGLSGAGLAIGGAGVRGSNSTTNPANYAAVVGNGILTFAGDPSMSFYAEGGLNFPAVVTANGSIGGQVLVGADWAMPELGGKVFGEVGWGIFRRTTIGSASGVMANLGYKFAF